MKVLIDNKEFSISFGEERSLSFIMEKVNEELLREGRLLFNIYINGKILNNNENIEVNDISLVEIFTKTPRSIILEALANFDNYLEKLSETAEVAMAYFQNGEEIFGEIYFVDVAQSLEWFNNILISIKENTAVDMGNEVFEKMFEEYSECFKRVTEAFEAKDSIAFFEMVDFEIYPILEEFRDILDSIYTDIMEEETRDKFYA